MAVYAGKHTPHGVLQVTGFEVFWWILIEVRWYFNTIVKANFVDIPFCFVHIRFRHQQIQEDTR